MKKSLAAAAVAAALLAGRPVKATTWGSQKVACPVCGNQLTGHSPASYGSYIYRWPSKVYLVFWPWTDGHFWWTCDRCGYGALGPDFAKLTPKQKAAIRTHVKPKWKRPKMLSMTAKMRQAETCYKHRGKDQDFWITFYRTAAWNTRGDRKTAAGYRNLALALMEKKLTGKGLDGRTRKELRYLVGEFSRIAGHKKKAISSLKIALKTKWAVGGKFSAGGDTYVNDLVNESLKKLGVKSKPKKTK